jgi:hypothetical protein
MKTILFLLLFAATAHAQMVPGQSYFSPDGYVEIQAGNLPFVLTVPHDGTIYPTNMDDRTKETCAEGSTFSFGSDGKTNELARNIALRFFEATGKHPWVIFNKIRRIKMDANRNLTQSACGDPDTAAAWQQWHDYIELARSSIVGRGFQFDIHGQGHPVRNVELGFMLTPAQLYNPEPFASSSSLYAFSLTHSGSFTTLLRDLGTRLTSSGVPALPSLQDWTVEPGQAFFTGGYLTSRYGCFQSSDHICAVQLEHPNDGVRRTTEQRTAYANVLVREVLAYVKQFGIVW